MARSTGLRRLPGQVLACFRFVTLFLWLLNAAAPFLSTAAADEGSEARELLRARGLSPQGRIWLCAEDAALRRRLDKLEILVRQVRASEERVEQLVARNEEFRTEFKKTLAALEEARRQDSANDPELKKRIQRLEQQRDALEKKFLAPQEFSSNDSVRDAVLQVIGHRQHVSLSVLSAPAEIFRVRELYAALNKDAELAAALAASGKGHRLPGDNLLAQYEARLNNAQRVATGRWVPLYQDGGKYRVPMLVEQRTPVTMTYEPGSGPGWLPDSVCRRAGIKVAADARPAMIQAEGGRHVPVHLVEVAYLQLGPHLLEKVQFHVLPPDAEDLGGRITDETLAGYAVRAEPERLRLVLGAEK